MQKVRLTNLDIVKMLACLAIVFHHYQQSTGMVMPYFNFYGNKVYDWSSVVELFFMISGYIAARNDDIEDKRCFRAFLYKYVRTLPSVIPAGLLLLAVSRGVYYKTGGWLFGLTYTAPKIIKSLLLIDRGWFGTDGLTLNNPTWFLSILLFCFALFYAFKRICIQFKAIKPVYLYTAVTVVYYILFRYGPFIYLPFFNPEMYRGAIPFFVGCILFYIYKMPDKILLMLRAVSVIFAILLHRAYGLLNSFFCIFWLYPCIVDAAVHLKQADSPLANHIGMISPTVYLWHSPLISTMLFVVISLNLPIPAKPVHMLLFTFAVCLFSALFAVFYERPVQLRIKKFFYDCNKKSTDL